MSEHSTKHGYGNLTTEEKQGRGNVFSSFTFYGKWVNFNLSETCNEIPKYTLFLD